MKFIGKESPIDIEKDFNKIKSEINNIILKEHKLPSQTLFLQLDNEFKNAKKKYEKINDQINLLHLEHNYLWCKSFQFLEDNPTKSLLIFISALSKLLERHTLQPYMSNKLKNMLRTYEVPLIKISDKKEIIKFDISKKEFLAFLEFVKKTFPDLDALKELLTNIIEIFVNNLYNPKIDELKVTNSNIEHIDVFVNEIKSILYFLEKMPSTKSLYLSSKCYEFLYKLRKKQLHFFVKSLYFEISDEKNMDTQSNIDYITNEMVEYSKLSLKKAKKYANPLGYETQKDKDIILMITLKEIDELSAWYYKEAYSDKDIINAWKIMDKIKHFLVIKAFKENTSISDNLFKFYAEEWSLLSTFAEIVLLKEDINKRINSLNQDWEKEIFKKILNSLEEIQKLFKYKLGGQKDYTLKIMSSSFAGSFSEYFIHHLFKEFFNYGKIDEKTPSEYKDLLESIKSVENINNIILNDTIFGANQPDIDIHINGRCAIFLKNSKVDSEEIGKIWREIELCNNEKIEMVFYCFNFIKNIEKIEFLRSNIEKIKNKFPHLKIKVYDIEDIIKVLLNELNRSGRSKFNFPELDLYEVLDY